MSYWIINPPETSSVRNMCRFDHNYVELTQDGLLCSPAFFDRLVDDQPQNKVNIFSRDDVENVTNPSRIMATEVLTSIIGSTLEKPRQDKYLVKSFQGDPIFRAQSSAKGESKKEGPFQPESLVQRRSSVPNDTTDNALDDTVIAERTNTTSAEVTLTKKRPSDGNNTLLVFDESRDADDEASSSKTTSSDHEELHRKLSIVSSTDSSRYLATLHRKPSEDFGFTLDTSFGRKLHVKKVVPGSSAFMQGLATGDQILAINNAVIEVDVESTEVAGLIKDKTVLHVIATKCTNTYQKVPCKRFTVELKSTKEGLGLSIGHNEEDQIVIKGITTGGVAHKDKRLKRGDMIVRVGEIYLEGMTTEEVGKLLKNCGKTVKLEVLQPKPNPNEASIVTLKRHSKFGLGLGVAIYTSKLGETCTVIKNLLPGSPADRCPKIRPGGEIIKINDQFTCYMDSNKILEVLKDKTITSYCFQIKHDVQSNSRDLPKRRNTSACCAPYLNPIPKF